MVGARVRGPRRLAAYLLAGGIGADLYGEDDAALLRRVGGLIAAQVAVLVGGRVARAQRTGRVAASGQPTPRSTPRELLATGTEFAETTRRVADLAARLLPFDEHALRDPAERGRSRGAARARRAPAAAGSAADSGRRAPRWPRCSRASCPTRSSSWRARRGSSCRFEWPGASTARWCSPRSPRPSSARSHLCAAQQLADIVACHLELLRRTALLVPPYLPGWKKVR